ncbi:DNA repair and recombination protein RadA [Candidatus Thorarchaeota archaeon]|jgi:DNA repair protein RadA|nr:MAG: DNA repair and recombination protein RadA [Candidatus Thorarchaeota archaeon]
MSPKKADKKDADDADYEEFEDEADGEIDDLSESGIDVTDLPGVGPAIGKRLAEAGYKSVEAIAVASPSELAAAGSIGETTATKIIKAAREMLDIGFETADLLLERRRTAGRITTSSTALDELFGGGIETQSITEMYGGFRSGKTQMAHQLALNIQRAPEEGGLNGTAIFVDTEGTFRPERLVDMAEAHGMDSAKVLQNVVWARAYNSDHQILLCDQAMEMAAEKNAKLLVVDSVTSHFRAEYTGRGTLAARQQKLNKHLHHLQRGAEINNMAVYITNQVMSRPDAFFGDPTAPVGGHVLAHVPQTRCYLRKSKGERRICRLVDSPNLPEGEAVFTITKDGIRDV